MASWKPAWAPLLESLKELKKKISKIKQKQSKNKTNKNNLARPPTLTSLAIFSSVEREIKSGSGKLKY